VGWSYDGMGETKCIWLTRVWGMNGGRITDRAEDEK
jgi:hypothetical protein